MVFKPQCKRYVKFMFYIKSKNELLFCEVIFLKGRDFNTNNISTINGLLVVGGVTRVIITFIGINSVQLLNM